MDYPKKGLISQDSGCKVGWLYYDTEQQARRASEIAYLEASQKARDGYDFGYQIPGECREVEFGADRISAWRVTIP